jgi:DNA-binding transcriptional MerR regulator
MPPQAHRKEVYSGDKMRAICLDPSLGTYLTDVAVDGMSNMDRPLTPAEIARRFGVTIKALRVYERHGLLTPLRKGAGATAAQWRAYGPQQLARLHQILALKRMGLSLARIGKILAGPDTLAAVLALQADALTRDRERLSQALALVRKAQEKLSSGQALSIDDLANLTKETVMTRPSVKELNQMLMPFSEKHFSPEEKKALRDGIDREQVAKDIEGLMAEAQALMQTGGPTSPAAQDLAHRWAAIGRQILAVDVDVKRKGKAMWTDAMNDPATAEKLALHRDIFRFVEQAVAHWKTLEK